MTLGATQTSHLPEELHVAAAHRQHFLAPLQVDLGGLVVEPLHVAYRAEVDDHGAMHLREALRVELAEEILQWGAYHRLARLARLVAVRDDGVLRVGAEEADVRPLLLEEAHRLAAVLRLGDDLELGPDTGELPPERLAQERLVVRDQRGLSRGSQRASTRAGKRTAARTPRGACSVTESSTSSPNSRRSRSRRLASPVPSPPASARRPAPVSRTDRTHRSPPRLTSRSI